MKDSISVEELKKAIETLDEALDFAAQSMHNETQFKIARDASIQRFKYCIELSWKVAARVLGSQTKFAKPAIREMARGDLIESAELWLDFVEARNQTSHSYDEKIAQNVFSSIQKFQPEVKKLALKLSELK